ncbi:MAG: formate dehydrogenase [Actinomycetia bacterium]|nr:formate dehydrogenase [Actinomycetes bacterium]
MFGAGGGTSSYEELRETADLIILWGSNARDAHPIFFHHLLKAVHRGAKLYVVDPRRTASAQWADLWLGLDVGTDIPLANAIAREVITAGLVNEEFVARATTCYDAYRESVEPWTLDEAERVTGVPADAIRELAHAWGNSRYPQMCWTLGITEHHNAVDNVLALINLSLLVGGVGRHGTGLQPLRGQNNVQGGGDMGAIPNKLPGFQDVEDDALRAKFDAAWGVTIPPKYGLHMTDMFEAIEEGTFSALYVIGENPAQSEADQTRARKLLSSLDCLVVQDIFRTKTAEMADVVLPASASWAETEGTVTSSERRVQRVRKALEPPGDARDDVAIVYELAQRLGVDLGSPRPEDVWNEVRTLSPMHAGMSYKRLEELGGIQWPCWDETHPGDQFLHGRLWDNVVKNPAPFTPVKHSPPVDVLDAEFPLRLTTGRRLESFNTGVQTGGFSSPLHVGGEALLVSPEDGARYGLRDGGRALVTSRRGAVEAPVAFDNNLRPGLAFMSLHFPDLVEVNVLTIDATDPKSGTAEFKATAIRVEAIA